MATDPRDVVWNKAFELYYDALYNEIIARWMVGRWNWIDVCSRTLITATASGSAIAGWKLWSAPAGVQLWLAISGTAAVLSIVHSIVNVPNRLKNWAELHQFFSTLRIDLEGFRSHMEINPEFDVAEYTGKLDVFRRRFGEGYQRREHDILLFECTEISAQSEVDSRLGVNR